MSDTRRTVDLDEVVNHLKHLNDNDLFGSGTLMRLSGEMVEEMRDLKAKLAAAEKLLVLVYNHGYSAGHHDTVEGGYTDIHQSDIDTYHADVVAEILRDNAIDKAMK